jgi:hypothetical protein
MHQECVHIKLHQKLSQPTSASDQSAVELSTVQTGTGSAGLAHT